MGGIRKKHSKSKANEEMAKVVIEKPNLDMDPMFGPHRMENGKLPQQQGQMPPEIPGGQQMGVGGYQPQMGGGGEYLQGGGGGVASLRCVNRGRGEPTEPWRRGAASCSQLP